MIKDSLRSTIVATTKDLIIEGDTSPPHIEVRWTDAGINRVTDEGIDRITD